MRRSLFAGWLAGTVALGGLPAHATTITQYASGGSAGHDTFEVVFQQAHLGPGDVLNAVMLTVWGDAAATAYIVPDNSFPVWAYVHVSIGVTVNGPGIPYKLPYTWPDFDLLASLTPVDGDATTSVYGSSQSLGPADRSPTLDYAPYVGPGTVPIEVSLSEDSDVCYALGGSIDCSVDFSWTVALVYDVTEGLEVPEPSGLLVLIGAGLGWMGLGRYMRTDRRQKTV